MARCGMGAASIQQLPQHSSPSPEGSPEGGSQQHQEDTAKHHHNLARCFGRGCTPVKGWHNPRDDHFPQICMLAEGPRPPHLHILRRGCTRGCTWAQGHHCQVQCCPGRAGKLLAVPGSRDLQSVEGLLLVGGFLPGGLVSHTLKLGYLAGTGSVAIVLLRKALMEGPAQVDVRPLFAPSF